MKNLKFLGVIPARYSSSRFPGKPLAKICGKMMIERVWQRVSSVLPNAIVATDDQRIVDAVNSFGGKVVMTSTTHRSGTDRCFEAFQKTLPDADVILNIQGDEPFIEPEQIKQLMSCFDSDDTDIATLVLPFKHDGTYEQLDNPNRPKVVIGIDKKALYFSRSVIPYLRGKEKQDWPKLHQYYTHVGMYAYRSNVLSKIAKMAQTPLEQAESLEQLRWLENGYTIRVAITESQSLGIDTPDDLKNAEEYIKSHNLL